MIVVNAQVWPHGAPPDSSYGREVAERQSLDVLTVIIVNDGTGNSDVGNYDVYTGDPVHRASWQHVGRIDAFPRGRKQSHAPYLVVSAMGLLPI